MKRILFPVAAMMASWAPAVFATNVYKNIIAELDPVAPISANYEETRNDVTTSKWGGNVDFNMKGLISTGPEFWSGSFQVRGPEEAGESVRREDFQYNERHKLKAIRLRWNFALWQVPETMRGWYIKSGYSYTRIDSRANRITEFNNSGDVVVAGAPGSTQDDDSDLITDERSGIMYGFGQRWVFADNKMTLTIGVSATSNFKRDIAIQSTDPQARADYDSIIEDLPETRMSNRPLPETNVSFGYAF